MALDNGTTEIDTEALSGQLANELLGDTGGERHEPADTVSDAAVDGAADDADASVDASGASEAQGRDAGGRFQAKDAAKGAVAAPAASANAPAGAELEMPKSWKKEWANDWKATPRAAQEKFLEREKQMEAGAKSYASDAEFGRTLRTIASRHADVLKTQGINESQAFEYLLNAHRQLSTGTPESRQAYLGKVAETYGLKLVPSAAADPNAPAPVELPPEVKAALQRLDKIEGRLTQDDTQRYEAHRAQIGSDVSAFADAKDDKGQPKHPYFDECADHICMLLKGDPSITLEGAYDKAVWANPVTRQKELARVQADAETASRKRAQEAAAAAKKGTATNVRGRDTNRAPQAPKATVANLDAAMQESFDEIKSRA